MVCHETYKDPNNNWVSPEEIITIEGKKYLAKDKTKLIKVGPSESMSKSKKNTIDPENIIKNFGADSVRLFILSDSPPEKDVQWSDEGIAASFKFIQKLWNLNNKFVEQINKNNLKDSSDKLIKFTHKFIKKIEDNLNNFNYNVIVANLHEMYSFLNKEIDNEYKKNTLNQNYEKILISIMPIIPHFSNECLNIINKNYKLSWPSYDDSLLVENTTNIVIQINGKKRGLINTNLDIEEEELLKLINQENNLVKYFVNKKIKKKIFIKNKLINIII
jgi:leucyl-tRNA synthetase